MKTIGWKEKRKAASPEAAKKGLVVRFWAKKTTPLSRTLFYKSAGLDENHEFFFLR